jgi:hypothetical protein
MLPGADCSLLQEYPSSATAGRGVFRFLGSLPSQLSPAGLAALVSVQLDAFPEAPVQWSVLQVRACCCHGEQLAAAASQ